MTSGRNLPLLLPLLAFCLTSATAGCASLGPAGNEYAVATITVLGGAPVREDPKGTILSRGFGPSCTVLPPQAPPGDTPVPQSDLPVVGKVGSEVVLAVTLERCRTPGARMDAATPVECRWSIPGTTSQGAGRWLGAEGELPLRLPERTGVYALSLVCTAGSGHGQDQDTVERPVFVLLSDPLLPADSMPGGELGLAPKALWYRRAVTWGAGFAAGAPVKEVLTQLTGRIYAYGGENWRYGSFPGDLKARLSLREQYRMKCYPEKEGQWCACDWKALVAENTPCNFGSCYQFSDVLHHAAALLGIRVKKVEIQGKYNHGFLTRTGAVALDPDFTNNVICVASGEDSTPCPPYLFSSHCVQQDEEGTLYDPTFNAVYRTEDDAIGISMKGWDALRSAYSFDEPELYTCLQGAGYGSWNYFTFPVVSADVAQPCQQEDPSDLSFRGPGARLSGPVTFTLSDPDEDGLVEHVIAQVEVTVNKGGTYLVAGTLTALPGEGGGQGLPRVVSRRPSIESHQLTGAKLTAEPGTVMAELVFSGAEIQASGLDGPYRLVATLLTAGRALDQLQVETPAWRHEAFAPTDD